MLQNELAAFGPDRWAAEARRRVRIPKPENHEFVGLGGKESGDGRARTDDPRLAKPVLSQLSYIPILGIRAACDAYPVIDLIILESS